MPSSILYTVTRPPKPKKDWLYQPTAHACDAAGCRKPGILGASFPLIPKATWWCGDHAPPDLFPMMKRRERAAFRLGDAA